MPSPLLSYTSPNYNGQGTIGRQLDSIYSIPLEEGEHEVVIGNELSEWFAKEKGIDKTTAYHALTQCYQMAFLGSTREERQHLRSIVDWKAYRRVSRTKLRHRFNYWRNRFI